MGTIENKSVVRAYFEAFSRADYDRALALTTEDLLICGMGKAKEVAFRWDKATARNGFAAMKDTLRSPFRITVDSMIAEGDQVAVKATSQVELRNGQPYSNNYHFLVTLRDGKIALIEEYCCTYEVMTVIHEARRAIPGGMANFS